VRNGELGGWGPPAGSYIAYEHLYLYIYIYMCMYVFHAEDNGEEEMPTELGGWGPAAASCI